MLTCVNIGHKEVIGNSNLQDINLTKHITQVEERRESPALSPEKGQSGEVEEEETNYPLHKLLLSNYTHRLKLLNSLKSRFFCEVVEKLPIEI